ncbi:hypothetical protein [Novosphingobium sp.]|uniref:hypothetical protein n=1 Tax=Novosphingobium sp. TaxID=1874826 RepID=UPI0028AFAAE3|nr:hypothetical protein [Novosphingobium sp.]
MLAGPGTAFAQATWSLPPGQQEGQSASRPQGPVDPQNPTVTPRETAPDVPAATPAATPSSAPTSRATPVPTIVAPPPPVPRASERPNPQTTAPAAAQSAAPTRPSQTPTVETATSAPSPTASPLPSLDPTPPAARESAVPSPIPSATPDTAIQPANEPHWPEWWLVIPAALVATGIGTFALLRRRRAPATAWEEAGLEPEAEPEDEIAEEPATPSTSAAASAAIAALDPTPAVTPVPRVQPPRQPDPQSRPLPQPVPPPAREPVPAPSRPGIVAVHFEPVSMRLSLVYATLQYRLALTAPDGGSAQSWQVRGDMISAHASLSQGEQLAPDPATLPLRHSLEALAPGETREFKGELQLPLNAIRVMRQGQASLFVPLVRLCLVDEEGHVERRVFTLGIPGDRPALGPLRLDTGPRDHATIAARAVEAARDMGQVPEPPIRRLA